ncbi:unnamed protein product [Pneumocystis jirovecii]|uniref:EF-hand domain-containing protein n=1 Tax=Pneumocystis jirovecii TaxID=42068 RepID=L0PFV6_PNEJI|nr:unnamed protein product [Pneumocystis jirovecii]CCJ31072.1 unnamed protein product [Pneumocystis jirovecii]
MKNEHHIESYNCEDFFYIHGFSFNGYWVAKDFRRIYGLDNEDLSEDDKQQLETKLLYYLDKNNDGIVTLNEFKEFINEGNVLPDLGFQGHHEDFETEVSFFDIHYIEVHYKDFKDGQSDWSYSECIEHFKKHREMFYKENLLLDQERKAFNTMNDINIIIIPEKYLRR